MLFCLSHLSCSERDFDQTNVQTNTCVQDDHTPDSFGGDSLTIEVPISKDYP
jgi:hypothetical protein